MAGEMRLRQKYIIRFVCLFQNFFPPTPLGTKLLIRIVLLPLFNCACACFVNLEKPVMLRYHGCNLQTHKGYTRNKILDKSTTWENSHLVK